MRCVIVIPCYNEEENIKLLIPAIDKVLNGYMPYQIIAVNDGSNDRTGEILKALSEKYPIKVVEHKSNKGLATAIKTGLTKAIEYTSDSDLIITMDGDNTHDPKYIPCLAEKSKKADIVISSRYIKGGRQLGVPLYRVILSRGLNLLTRLLVGIPVKDATSGYRCYKASALKKAMKFFGEKFIESQGFEALFEILVKTYWCNRKISEIPNTLDYGKKIGKSKIKLVLTMLGYLNLLRKVCLWRVSGVPKVEDSHTLQSFKRIRRS